MPLYSQLKATLHDNYIYEFSNYNCETITTTKQLHLRNNIISNYNYAPEQRYNEHLIAIIMSICLFISTFGIQGPPRPPLYLRLFSRNRFFLRAKKNLEFISEKFTEDKINKKKKFFFSRTF